MLQLLRAWGERRRRPARPRWLFCSTKQSSAAGNLGNSVQVCRLRHRTRKCKWFTQTNPSSVSRMANETFITNNIRDHAFPPQPTTSRLPATTTKEATTPCPEYPSMPQENSWLLLFPTLKGTIDDWSLRVRQTTG